MSLTYKVNGMDHFVVDEANSDEQYCYIDMPGVGTVSIKKDDEGVVIDVFSQGVKDSAVASTYALYSELNEPDELIEYRVSYRHVCDDDLLFFMCKAADAHHAIEQWENAYPDHKATLVLNEIKRFVV